MFDKKLVIVLSKKVKSKKMFDKKLVIFLDSNNITYFMKNTI